jgi:signal transduction histidine kinase
MQKEFINIASHELKTPVQSILGYSELLLEHPENFQKLAEGVRRNALRLEKLTNNILDVSRIDSNRLKLRKEVLNINEKIANVVKDLSLNSEIKINIIEPSVNPIVVEADKVRMYQVLSNLLTNAIKFSRIRRDEIPNAGHKAGNDITIYTEVRTSPRHEVVIAVKDRGTGITADFQDKLFSKFASKSEEGMGLGLFISRGIVEAHNGKIWAENNRDGGGATFAFSLPLDSA